MSTSSTLMTQYSGKERVKYFDYLKDASSIGAHPWSANADYSTTPHIFAVTPAVGIELNMQSLLVSVESSAINADTYGVLAALTNGVKMRVINDSVLIQDLSVTYPIKTLKDYGRYGIIQTFEGATNSTALIMIDFTRLNQQGQGIKLVGDYLNKRFEVLLNDNFSTLVTHTFWIQGDYSVESASVTVNP